MMINAQTERTIHVAKAGTLKNLIPENEKFQIEKLTLTGEINGTDFRLLREMAGKSFSGGIHSFSDTEGKLAVLDLSEVKIVAGGDFYLESIDSDLEDVVAKLYLRSDDEFPSRVFEQCRLSSVILPSCVTNVGYLAFFLCRNLTSIIIPKNVTSLSDGAFDGCSSLTYVYCYAVKVPETDSNAFGYQGEYISNAILHVPAGSISAYSNTVPWCYFKEIVAISNESTDEPQGDGYHFFVVKAKDGTSTTFALSDEPKITNNNGELTIQGSNSTFKIRLSVVQSFKFLKQTTGIYSIIKDEDVRVINDCVVFDSLPTGSKVSVYMADGTLIKNFVADGNDSLVIGLSELPKGILVLHSARTNIKVINK